MNFNTNVSIQEFLFEYKSFVIFRSILFLISIQTCQHVIFFSSFCSVLISDLDPDPSDLHSFASFGFGIKEGKSRV